MDPRPMPPTLQHAHEYEEPAGPDTCPVCGSPTVPLRGLLRCTLCSLVLCEGCEGLQPQD
jgi:hypothetical protein